jgi:hypothetical protein
MAYVYILDSGSDGVFKIGRTRGDVAARVKALSTGNPRPLTVFDVIETDHDSLCESYLHNRLRTKRRGGEFFELEAPELRAAIDDARQFIADFVPKQHEVERLAAGESEDRAVEPGLAELEAYRELLKVREDLDDLRLRQAELETALKLAIGTASELNGLVSWKTHAVQRLDVEALRTAEPQVYERFVRDSRVRTFRLLTSRGDDSA